MKLRVLVAVLLLVAAGYLAWHFTRGRGPLLGSRLSDLAVAAPAESQFFLAIDMRQRNRLSQVVKMVREVARDYPDLLSSDHSLTQALAELEKKAPAPLEEMADWVAPAGCVAFFPRTGEASLFPSKLDLSPPFELVVVLALYQPTKVHEQIGPRLEKSGAKVRQEGQVTYWEGNTNGNPYVLALYREALLLSNSLEGCNRSLQALQRKTPALADQADYRAAIARVQHDQGGLLYLTPGRTLSPLSKLPEVRGVFDEQTAAALESMTSLIGTVTPKQSGFGVEGFLALDAASTSAWTKALLTAPKSPARLAALFPADWGNYQAINLPYVYRGLTHTVMLAPKARMQVGALAMLMQGSVGFTPERLFQTLTGEVGLSTHFDPNTPQSGVVLLALGLQDRGAFEGLLEKLSSHIGSLQALEQEGSSQVYGLSGLPGARLVFLEQPPAVLLAAGPSARQGLRLALDAAGGKQPSVATEQVLKQALEASGEDWVAMNYLDLKKASQPVLEAMKSERLTAEQARLVKTLTSELSEIRDASVLLVEPQGLRFRSFGPGPYSLTFTGGLLAAVLVPNFVKARGQGQLTACQSNLKNEGTALEMYAVDNAGRYPATMARLTPNYLKVIPNCPAAGTDTYSESYQVAVEPDAFTLACRGHHHASVGMQADRPAYNSVQGLLGR
ncbi:MAG: hypothetical protein AMXMBFR33_73660 [Candidatus Xenobia bacterium]